ncbi:hypothetical protein PMI02_03880 [Novosphingobium sp. AP12]|nr:hypothetical protein PMI02_03880 [Novosphingobium sp. AP12]
MNDLVERRHQSAEMAEWITSPATDLEAAIARFKADLPGWWFSVGECQISCDASCAPTDESEHIALAVRGNQFDSGFDCDLAQPSTLALALDEVRKQALAAIAEAGSNGVG